MLSVLFEDLKSPIDDPDLPRGYLHVRLADAIVGWLGQEGAEPGRHVTQIELCQRFQVSKTPVRAALQELRRRGLMELLPERGAFLIQALDNEASLADAPIVRNDVTCLVQAMAQAHRLGALPARFSFAYVANQFSVSKTIAKDVCEKLEKLGLAAIAKRCTLGNADAVKQVMMQSVAFRRLLEPALLESALNRVPAAWIVQKMARYQAIRKTSWMSVSMNDFNALNVQFHMQLAAFAGNPHATLAMRDQMLIQSFADHAGHNSPSQAHILISIYEHMEILGYLQKGDPAAARCLRDHLGHFSPQ